MPKTTTPLLQLIPARAHHTHQRLFQRIWKYRQSLQVYYAQFSEGENFPSVSTAQNAVFDSIAPGKYFSETNWSSTWFRIEIPAQEQETDKRYLSWHADGETTVYHNSLPWAGLDIAHENCPLPDDQCVLYLDCGNYQTAISVPQNRSDDIGRYGLQFHGAELLLRDEIAWETFHDFDVLLQLMEYHLEQIGFSSPRFGHCPVIEKCPALLRRLLHMIDDSIDIFDKQGLKDFSQSLKKIYNDLPGVPWNNKIGFVGHSHMDLVWLWPEEVTYRKIVHTYATTLQLMEKYPEMIFTMSQPPLLEKIQNNYPSQYSAIIQRIREERWEATGSLEVEADTSIPVGEALVRAITCGRERFKQFRGDYPNTLWLPDVFGYSQCLPQLCALTGIENFFTTKISWSQITKFPHDSFVWQGPDGSQVLAHLSQCPYVAEIRVKEAIEFMKRYRQSGVHDEILIAAGHGDGGGGLTESHCERLRRLTNLADIPKSKWTSVEKFFERLQKVKKDLPVYRGELYLEFHRGTLTTQSDIKLHYRRAEQVMQIYEATCALHQKKPENQKPWLRIIFAQFHDCLPGSSIELVYRQQIPELISIVHEWTEKTKQIWQEQSKVDEWIVHNPLPIAHSWVIDLPAPLQNTHNDLAYISLKGLESKKLEKDFDYVNEFVIEPDMISNGIVKAGFNDKGQLKSLSIAGTKTLLTKPCRFTLHEDNPVKFDAWDIDHHSTWLKQEIPAMQLKISENGPLRAQIKGQVKIGHNSTLTVSYLLEKNSPYLKISAIVDWNEAHKLLCFEIPTDYKGSHARYGCAFGSIDRPQRPGTPSEEAMWQVAGSRWMAATDDAGNGLAIITEAKYGFSCKDGLAAVSLLRSACMPQDHTQVETKIADTGRHEIHFALALHHIDTNEHHLSTAAAAEVLYSRPLIVKGNCIPFPFTLEKLEGVVPSWLKPTENGFVIRLHETAGKAGSFRCRLFRKAKVTIVDLLENFMRNVENEQDCFIIPYQQKQIISLKIDYR